IGISCRSLDAGLPRVPFPGDNARFSAPLMFRNKAQLASNGCSLAKGCNAVAGHQGSALRVSLPASMDCVVPLAKGTTIPCETRLALNADKLTESGLSSGKGTSGPPHT
ncbi:MAG: hypothetical protein KAG66_00810, partial [Methylococcales bacterium]|nr:hypothetical protein [Methylococcales bacterium]